MNSSTVHEAMALAHSGRPMDGLLELREAQSRADPEAYLLEGLWLVEGRFVPRDLPVARDRLAAAAELGHVGAARTLAGFIACGVGAAPDWASALFMLESWADADPVAAAGVYVRASLKPSRGVKHGFPRACPTRNSSLRLNLRR